MPRTYTRKTEKQSWTQPQLLDALKAIQNGSSVRGAGKQFGIPESTLRDKMKIDGVSGLLPKLGRKPTFTSDQEKQIANHVIKLANMFYGLTPKELRKLAYDYATNLNLKHEFDNEKKLAGKDWLYGFLSRNTEIRLREPENTSINRIAAFNEEEVKRFYENLEEVFKKHPYPPSRIFNMDESGMSNVQKTSCKVYARKGQKRVGTATLAERGRTITLVCCFSAAGSYVPPMVIYPRKRMAAHLKRDGPADTLYECSSNGWSNEELFVKWLHHFIKHTKPSESDPILLICDNHGSHITLESYDICKNNYITVVSIPPHTSHRLQPLDLTFFSPIKGALSREFGLFMTQNAHRKIITSDIPGLLNRAYIKVATMEKGIKGFSSAGIYPLQPDKFNAEDFEPANEFLELTVEDDPASSSVLEPSGSLPGPSNTNQAVSIPNNLPGPSSRPISLADIAPIPKHNNKNEIETSANKKQHSQILTSTPIKLALEEKKRIKEMKEKEKQDRLKKKQEKPKRKLCFKNKPSSSKPLKKKKRIIEVDDSSEGSDVPLNEICDDDELDDVAIGLSDQKNDICIYCDEGGRDNELWFRCVQCGFWAHAECSGWESAEDYECDGCLKKKKVAKKKGAKNENKPGM